MMKKLLVALLAAALALCWCGTAMAVEKVDIPLTADAVPVPEYMNDAAADLKAERVSDTEYKFTWDANPFGDQTGSFFDASITWSTEKGSWHYDWVHEEDVVKTDTGWSYTWEVPEGYIEDSMTFTMTWVYLDDITETQYTETQYSQSYLNWDDDGYIYSKTSTKYTSDSDYTRDRVTIMDGELTSYETGGVAADYSYGELVSYTYTLDNGQHIEFDPYGKITSCNYHDVTAGRTVYYNSDDGWYYWNAEGNFTETSMPEGAVDPETLEPIITVPVPQFTPPATLSDIGFPSKLPVTADDLPTIESIEEKDGYWVVTLSGALDKNDYKTDNRHKASADITIDYWTAEGDWSSLHFNWEGDHHEGNVYYFAIPEGGELNYPSIEFTIQDGAATYNLTKDDDGYFYANGYTNDYFSTNAHYNSDGELISASYFDREAGTWSYWYFYGDDDLLTSYEIAVENGYFITYLADGTVESAYKQTMTENENGSFSFSFVYWDAENGWHTRAWDDETDELIITPADAPEGVKNPTEYPAPYVLAEKVLKHTWYPHNTVCVAGIEFRDAKPELTKKWYNFAAVDLSQEGTQTFDLVASNMYVVGTVTVTRTGDEVVVDWKLRLQGTTDANFDSESEFLTFFSSLDAVTEVEPEWYDGPVYHFGEPISIEKDLGGDTNVLLYIRNVATYCDNLSYKYQRPIYQPRYDENSLGHRMLRDAMQAIMDADTVK